MQPCSKVLQRTCSVNTIKSLPLRKCHSKWSIVIFVKVEWLNHCIRRVKVATDCNHKKPPKYVSLNKRLHLPELCQSRAKI